MEDHFDERDAVVAEEEANRGLKIDSHVETTILDAMSSTKPERQAQSQVKTDHNQNQHQSHTSHATLVNAQTSNEQKR